jgi:hypothetical protein
MGDEKMQRARIKRLADGLLEMEVFRTQMEINRLESNIRGHRANAVGNAVITQMDEHAKLNEQRAHIEACNEEIGARKESGKWNPQPIERQMTKLEKPPIPPALKPVVAPRYEDMEGEELPIKVIDKGFPRAWRPEDGPIHGSTPADTITDVSKTTNTEVSKTTKPA